MRAGVMLEEHHKKILMDKHMGCMAGLFHLFDRHHLLAATTLPPPSVRRPPLPAPSSSPFPSSKFSPCPSPSPQAHASSPSPSPSELSDASPPPSAKLPGPRPTLPLPLLDFQDGPRAPWKLKDSPRLSLDSRAPEARGKPRPSASAGGGGGGSPSVVARLMGLDALPELRRSASESRASRDLLPCTFVRDLVKDVHEEKPKEVAVAAKARAAAPKSSFDARDFFPEKTAQRGSLYGEIERKLRTRGIDEPVKDLETLKQILEALQLKGLLRSHHGGRRNLIVEERRDAPRCRSPASPPPPPPPQRNPPPRRGRTDASTRTRKVRPVAEARSPTTAAPRQGAQKASPVKSPRSAGSVGPRRARTDSSPSTPSPRARRAAATTATADLEKLRKMEEECSQGRSLLQRCDKLLHSIAAITERGEAVEPPQQQQPSPVSVFDSAAAFYSDDAASAAASPSSMDSKDRAEESVDRRLTPSFSPAKLLQPLDEAEAADCDFACVSDAIGSGSSGFPMPRKETEESSNARLLHRTLLFDTVAEILERTKQISPWEAFRQSRSPRASSESVSSARRVWEEVKRLREHVPADSHADAVSGAVRKDMAATAGGACSWRERPAEMSGAVLDIERLIFKDLVRDTIRDLALAGKCSPSPAAAPRRRLVY